MDKYQEEINFMNKHGISEFDIPEEYREEPEGKQIIYEWKEGE